MPRTNPGWWGTLDRQRAQLFIVGGVIALLSSLNELLQAFTATSFQNTGGILLIGHILAFIGLLGFYPELSERNYWLAGAGAITAALGAVGMLSTVVLGLANLAGALPENLPSWLGIGVPLAILGMVVGYLAFGAASLRADIHPNTLGYALFIPAIAFGLVVLADLAGGTGQWGFILSAAQALGFLGIGYILRTID